jgi:hypothetical protein
LANETIPLCVAGSAKNIGQHETHRPYGEIRNGRAMRFISRALRRSNSRKFTAAIKYSCKLRRILVWLA